MPLKKELRVALEEVKEILNGLSDISPANKMDIGRKGLASKALEEIIPDCVNMIENILWCNKFDRPLEEENFYLTLKEAKYKKNDILERAKKYDENPLYLNISNN